ncbi:MAG: DUF998 domain-containing protein [Mycobacterium sp.]
MVAAVVYLSVEAVAAHAESGYSYPRDFISDLGRSDSVLNWAMNTAFVVQGVLFLAGALLVVRANSHRNGLWFLVFAASNAVGNSLVAAIPSDAAGMHWWHVGGAALAIVGGNAAIVAGAPSVASLGAPRWYRSLSTGVAVVGLVSVGVVAFGAGAIWERTSVYTIIGWQTVSAVCLVASRRAGRSEVTRANALR